jgi:hypothetical protein
MQMQMFYALTSVWPVVDYNPVPLVKFGFFRYFDRSQMQFGYDLAVRLR